MSQPLQDTLEYFSSLEALETRKLAASESMQDLFDEAIKSAEQKIGELCTLSSVNSVLITELTEFEAQKSDVDYLLSNPVALAGIGKTLEEKQKELEARENDPLHRLARRFLGTVALEETTDLSRDHSVKEVSPDKFFERNPHEVAEDLLGIPLKIGRTTGIIVKTLPQDENDNANWIEKRPLFGVDPVDAYVAPFRGSHMLFLRTAPNTCVRVDSVEIDGEVYKNPGQVCRAFGLDDERTGRVVYDGKTVKILR